MFVAYSNTMCTRNLNFCSGAKEYLSSGIKWYISASPDIALKIEAASSSETSVYIYTPSNVRILEYRRCSCKELRMVIHNFSVQAIRQSSGRNFKIAARCFGARVKKPQCPPLTKI